MSSFESFYGGRQGASFVIVKRFDGLDIPNTTYRVGWFAKDNDGYFYVPLIERTADNYSNYPGWGSIPKDGITTVTSKSGITSEPLDLELAEGMKQCFQKGGMSTSEVGYGEYVIIDTISGLTEYNNPDNGKVYRRGMNFDDDLGGAEYIGQITGPKGESPELGIGHYNTISSLGLTGSYTVANNDLLPGKYIENNTVKYNDDINYTWYNLRDNFGNIIEVLIGFQFPYLVEEFTANQRLPYYQAGDTIPGGKQIGDLLANDFELIRQVDDGAHPFYRKWKVNIPKGIKGDSQTNLEIYPTKAHSGAQMYSASTCAAGEEDGIATGAETISSYDNSLSYIRLDNGKYIKNLSENKWGLRIRYKQWVYDNVENPTPQYIDVGPYDILEKISLSQEGILTAYYTNRSSEELDEKIRWIDYEEGEAQGIYLEEDGTLVIVYNTKVTDPISGELVNEIQKQDKAISWITSITLDEAGHFKIIYNNDNNIGGSTGTEVDPSDPSITRSILETTLKTITDIKINVPANSEYGNENQKVSVHYSTNEDGVYTDLGNPLNYIIDSTVVTASQIDLTVEDTREFINHLIVLYSDPVRRNNAQSYIKNKQFYSRKLNQWITGWTDLGDVGSIQGINICKVYDMNQSGTVIPTDPPETLMGNNKYTGWMIVVVESDDNNLYTYDYSSNIWAKVGQLTDTSSVDPGSYITILPNSSTLKVNGFYLTTSTISTIH